MRNIVLAFYLILAIIFTGPLSAQQISFQKIVEIQPDQLQGTFITDIDVTESGFIAVALNDIAKVHLYNIEGKLINEYGRRGRGPGDFTNLMSVELTDSVVYAMDSGPSGRIHAFNRHDPKNYQTYLIPRSPDGRAVRMWHIGSVDFLVEFRPSFSNLNIENELTSKFGLVSIIGNDEIHPVIENRSNEMFVDQSDGGFSISAMPFGRKNFIIPAGNNLYHNWSDEFKFQKIGLNSSEKRLFEPEIRLELVPITEEGYREYFMNELGISMDDNVEEVLRSLSTDRSARLTIRTVQAKMENRDKLHDYYPAYKWITGDKKRLCFGMYTEDITMIRVACIDEKGTNHGEGMLSSDVNILSQSSDFMAGVRQLENGLQSVVLYKIKK